MNSKYLSLALLILVVTVFAANRWGLPSLPTMGHSAKNNPVKPLAEIDQAIPEEFIEFDGQDDEDGQGGQNFAALTTQALWQNLLAGFQKGEKIQVGLENALVMRLRKEPGNTIYEELLSHFKSGILDATDQQVLLGILGEVGNYRAAETLMRLVSADWLRDPDVKLSAFHAISKFAPESWGEHPNTELAPVFEAAWQTQQDPEFLSAIANVMASIGTLSTLDMFIQTLTDNTNEERVDIVKQAMTNLVNPALVPRLDDLLHKSPVVNVQIASGYALANMGEIEAASALFNWSTQVDVGRVDLVKIWFETAMNTTPEFIGYLEANLATQPFAAPEIKQAINGVLVDVKNGVE